MNKRIVKFKTIEPNGSITIDGFNPDFRDIEWKEVLDTCLPFTSLYKHISIKNFTSISQDLITRLLNQYLHGAEIEFNTPYKKFQFKSLALSKPSVYYVYRFETLDFTQPIPKSLAEFEFKVNDKVTTYKDYIKKLTNIRYIPNELWNAIDDYNRSKIEQCREFNKGDYSQAEQWLKDLMKETIKHNIKMFSPNKKTYYEAIAEVEFDKACDEYRLKQGLRGLNQQELIFLHKYAPAYGVDIPTFKWKVNSRKTDHGYTQEPEMVYCAMSTYDWNKIIFDPRNKDNLPAFVRQGLNVRECENDKLLREAYFTLKWLMKHLKDQALMPGWKRCPHCHKLYRESEGCECGFEKPVEFVQADNMFYGISSTYEDYDSTHDSYFTLEDFEDTF